MKQTRMPVLKQIEGGDEGFEGAIVLDPTPGIYLDDPIAVLDFASLYPSCIIEKNCSHETFISDTKYIKRLKSQNQIDDICNVVTYDNYKYIKVTETSKTLKKVPDEENPVTTCYFKKSVRNEEGIIEKESMGILPTVLDHLLSSRKSVKRQIKKESNPDKVKVLDGLQLAYKVTANSVYGHSSDLRYSKKKSPLQPHRLVENISMMQNEVCMNGLNLKSYRNQRLYMEIQILCLSSFQEPILKV